MPEIVRPVYPDAVRRAGGEPVLIGPGAGSEALDGVDGLLITGGDDVDFALYGGAAHPEQQPSNPARDQTELALLRRAIREDLPTFCICRGTQLLNVLLGGTLIQHVPDVYGREIVHRDPGKPCFHSVTMQEGSLVSRIVGKNESRVYSLHHQAIGDLGRDLVVTARASDGLIEVVALPGHRWLLAVQWHPERSAAEDADQQALFDALIAECGRLSECR